MTNESIEELMKNVSQFSGSKKNGHVAQVCNIAREMLKVQPAGVTIGFVARVATAKLMTKEQIENKEQIDYSVVRHAVLKSREHNQFTVFKNDDGLMSVKLHVPKK